MTDHTKRSLDLTTVRIIGPPETVDQVVNALTDALPATSPSHPYPSRRNPGHVRVYLEVTPK